MFRSPSLAAVERLAAIIEQTCRINAISVRCRSVSYTRRHRMRPAAVAAPHASDRGSTVVGPPDCGGVARGQTGPVSFDTLGTMDRPRSQRVGGAVGPHPRPLSRLVPRGRGERAALGASRANLWPRRATATTLAGWRRRSGLRGRVCRPTEGQTGAVFLRQAQGGRMAVFGRRCVLGDRACAGQRLRLLTRAVLVEGAITGAGAEPNAPASPSARRPRLRGAGLPGVEPPLVPAPVARALPLVGRRGVARTGRQAGGAWNRG